MFTVALSITLVLVSLALAAMHVRAWRAVDHGGLAAAEQEFHERRYRRRLQSSLMLGVIGLLLVVGDVWLDQIVKDAWGRLLYWSGVVLLLLWMLMLAASDWLASRRHYRGQLNRLLADRDVLRADLERIRREHRERHDPKISPDEN